MSHIFASILGKTSIMLITIPLICFGFSSILGWAYYGERSIAYLSDNNAMMMKIYKIVFSLFIIVGAVLELTLAWDISDTLNGLMAIPNLIAILMLSGVVVELTKKYLKDPASVNMK